MMSKLNIPDNMTERPLDWILKSNAAVQVNFDGASAKDFPKLKEDLKELILQTVTASRDHALPLAYIEKTVQSW
jgi:hypothetical protein